MPQFQEIISTSAKRGLDGNSGFGIVARTEGMSENVSRAADGLSGYTRIAVPGSGGHPVAYLHVKRRTGMVTYHIISRVADCGKDYSSRENRIAHHWFIEEGAIRDLPGGPARLSAQQHIFRTQWNEPPKKLPKTALSSADALPKKCSTWAELTGDAGWGGIVAGHAERGYPINILFTPEHKSQDLLTLIGEALALLPPPVRWKITFSTYFMKSQETNDHKILIKFILAGSEEASRLQSSRTSNLLVIDLQKTDPLPAGKYVNYVELARHGVVSQEMTPLPLPAKPAKLAKPAAATPSDSTPEPVYEVAPNIPIPGPLGLHAKKPTKQPLNYGRGMPQSAEGRGNNNDMRSPLHPALLLLSIVLVLLLIAGIVVAVYWGLTSVYLKHLEDLHRVLKEERLPVEPAPLGEAVKGLKENITTLEAEKQNLQTTIGQRNQTIGTLEADKRGLEGTVAARNQTIETLEDEKRGLESVVADRSRRIVELQNELKNIVAQHDQALTQRDRSIVDLRQQIQTIQTNSAQNRNAENADRSQRGEGQRPEQPPPPPQQQQPPASLWQRSFQWFLPPPSQAEINRQNTQQRIENQRQNTQRQIEERSNPTPFGRGR